MVARRRRNAYLAAWLAVISLVLAATPAFAGDSSDIGSVARGSTIDVSARKTREGDAQSDRPSGRRPIVRFISVCNGRPGDRRTHNFAVCAQAAAVCPDPEAYLAWREVAVQAPDGTVLEWVNQGTVCVGGGRPLPTTPVPVFTVDDLRRLPLPKAKLNVQPPTGRTLVNVATNLYASSTPRTFDITLLGTPVRVNARPVSWTWTYGDGSTRTFSTPGAAYPDLTTAHTWSGPGEYAVGLTTTWTATYSVAGGPDLPVDGTAEVVSPAVTVTAVATRAELVADPRL